MFAYAVPLNIVSCNSFDNYNNVHCNSLILRTILNLRSTVKCAVFTGKIFFLIQMCRVYVVT